MTDIHHKPVGFYGPFAPLGPNAPSSECPPNVMNNSEFRTYSDPECAPFWIYEHAQCRVFERTSLQHAYVIPCRKWGRRLCYGNATARWWLQRARCAGGGHIALDGGVTSILVLWRLGADFKQGSYRSSKTKFPDFLWLSQSITQHFPDLYWHKFQYWNSVRTQ